MNVQTARKKEPSVRWLRVGIENSNNFSLKKSTLDTLLLRTYKQTELLCTHINTHNSVPPWLSPCRASGSCRNLQRTPPQVSEPSASSPESFQCQKFLAGADESKAGRNSHLGWGRIWPWDLTVWGCGAFLPSPCILGGQMPLVPRCPTSRIIKSQGVTLLKSK